MTLQRFRELVTLVPFRNDRFGVQNRLLSFIDRELIALRGPEADAPQILWDDHGMMVYSEDDQVAIYFGARIEGMWLVPHRPPPATHHPPPVTTP